MKPHIIVGPSPPPPPLRQTDTFGRGVYSLHSTLSAVWGLRNVWIFSRYDNWSFVSVWPGLARLQDWLPPCSRYELELQSSGCSQATSSVTTSISAWREKLEIEILWILNINSYQGIKFVSWNLGLKIGLDGLKLVIRHSLLPPLIIMSPENLVLSWKMIISIEFLFFSKYFPLMFW